MKLPYTIVIQWSDEDGCYLVHLPEFPHSTISYSWRYISRSIK